MPKENLLPVVTEETAKRFAHDVAAKTQEQADADYPRVMAANQALFDQVISLAIDADANTEDCVFGALCAWLLLESQAAADALAELESVTK